MVDTEAYVYSLLSQDATLLSLVGSVDHISSVYPEKVTLFPYIVFREDNQSDFEFADNFPTASDALFIIDIFVKEADTYPFAKAVYDIFYPLNWTCEYSSDSPDPDIQVRHRVMRFRRSLFAGDV